MDNVEFKDLKLSDKDNETLDGTIGSCKVIPFPIKKKIEKIKFKDIPKNNRAEFLTKLMNDEIDIEFTEEELRIIDEFSEIPSKEFSKLLEECDEEYRKFKRKQRMKKEEVMISNLFSKREFRITLFLFVFTLCIFINFYIGLNFSYYIF